MKTITFEEACTRTGKSPETAIKFPNTEDATEKHLNDILMLDVYSAALNGEKKAVSFENSEPKYRPIFYVDRSGFRFSSSYCADSGADADSGSRLCHWFNSREEADCFGQSTEEIQRRIFYHK